jgi:hypothetical protein
MNASTTVGAKRRHAGREMRHPLGVVSERKTSLDLFAERPEAAPGLPMPECPEDFPASGCVLSSSRRGELWMADRAGRGTCEVESLATTTKNRLTPPVFEGARQRGAW